MMIAVLLFYVSAIVAAYASPSSNSLHSGDNHDLIKTTVVTQPAHIQVHEPALTKVGELVETIPTAVSHQSSTIVHNHAQRIRSVLAPAIRSYVTPGLHTTVVQEPLQHTMYRIYPLPLSNPNPNSILLSGLYNGFLKQQQQHQRSIFGYGTLYYL